MKPISISLEEWCKKNGHDDILQNYNRGKNSFPASKIGKATTKKVQWKCADPKHSPWLASPAAVTWKCSGCPTCHNRRIEPKVNDILTLFPNICKDWDFEKSTIDIRSIAPGSNTEVWWKCSRCGREWKQSPAGKINTKRIDVAGCADCRKDDAMNINQSLEDWCRINNQLEILKEYNSAKNELPPSKISKGSSKKVKWKCKKGHIWDSPPSNRTNPKKARGCPVCGHRKLVPGVNDFGTLFPDIAKEWDYEKNYPKTPADVFPGNNTTWYWWKCKKRHSYKAKLNNKTSPANQTKCPYCSNNKVLPGFNDLETWCRKNGFNNLIKEYAPDNSHKMSEILYGHDKKAKWICSVCGNHYSSNVYYRTKGIGCPECSKANQSSLPEQALYYYAKKLFPDAKNSFKEIFDNMMELDVFIPTIKTGIEYDGVAWHNSKKARNRERIKYQICKKNNIKLIRVREGKNTRTKLSSICDKCFFTSFTNRNYTELNRIINEVLLALKGSTVDVNCERDLPEIMSSFIRKKLKHSLAEDYPKIAEEWDYEKNGNLTPEMVKPHSGKKVWWKCKHQHPSYNKTVYERTGQKYGCPYCANRLPIPGKTDILTLFPNICKDWDFERNSNIDIHNIKPGSQQKVWWKCIYCGKEWQQTPNRKINRYGIDVPGCTECRRKRTKKSIIKQGDNYDQKK